MRISNCEIHRSNFCRILVHIGMFVLGAIFLSLFSIFQKGLLGLPITMEIRAFVVPIAFGGASGLLVSIFLSRLRIANNKLRLSREYLQDFMDNASDLIQSVSPDGTILYTNRAWQETMGYTQAELENIKIFSLISPEDREICREHMLEVSKGKTMHVEFAMLSKEGKKVFLDGQINCRIENSLPVSTRGIFRNVTAKRDIEAAQRLAAKVFQRANDGIFVTDSNGSIIAINEAFTLITGYSIEDVFNRLPMLFFDTSSTPEKMIEKVHEAIENGESWQGEIVARRKNLEVFPALLKVGTVQDPRGQNANFIGSITDITVRKQTEKRLQHLATHDVLTNLPNRVLFVDRLQNAIWRAEQSGNMVGVLFLDLDGFKSINDTHGHLVGDEYMKIVAHRLKNSIRTSDTAARLGGDEFAIILENIAGKEDAINVAGKVLKNLSKPVEINNHTMGTTASIGISLYPEHGTEQSLLASADQAMYKAKSNGKNQYFIHKDES